MKRKRYLYSLLLVLAITGYLSYVFIFSKSKQDNPESGKGGNSGVAATVYIVKPQNFSNGIQAVGTLIPNEEVDLISEVSGKVVGIYFKEGAQVSKGQLLIKVDDADLQAQLQRAEHQLKLSSERLNRQKILLEKDAVSREEFDQAQTDYNILQTDIDLLKTKISKTEIVAPFSGTIGFRTISLGSYLQPNTVISHLVDQSKLKLEFSIPERYAALSLEGKLASFRAESSNRVYDAKVYAVDPKVDIATRTITVRALYDNSSRLLSGGMFVRLDLITEARADMLLIPTEAIVPEMNGSKVWMLRDGKAMSKVVTTDFRSGDKIEIKSGLKIGDSVMVTGLMQVREDIPVKVDKVL
ncbi:MAG: efflux RND transporter periplasmic adaptor subunit [Bacteroidales bacterium]|jgi:membrane fusion protein (multidrug efflux system)|nr:efflux RND transporter periplasmic adaptor subunit [Bacteroidales bacterium]